MAAKRTPAKPTADKATDQAVDVAPKTKWRDAPLAALALVVVLVGGTAWYLRQQTRASLETRGDYLLELREIELSPLPAWIRSDPRAEALRDASLNPPLSTLDADLPEKLRRAFSIHPWIENVRGVELSYPAAAFIDVEYRRPIAMVEVVNGLLPVDARGVLLPPRDFDRRTDVRDYPRIVGALGSPASAVGTVWNDTVVQSGAGLAQFIEPVWTAAGFARIRWLDDSQDLGRATRYFLLETRAGGIVIWGQSPGREYVGEPTAAEKLVALRTWTAAPGGLDQIIKARAIDLRDKTTWPPAAATSTDITPSR